MITTQKKAKMQETVKKSTSERLYEILAQLSKDQLRYVVALQDYPDKKSAAEAIDIKPNTAYKWPDIVDEAARLIAVEAADSALAIRRRNLVKAMAVKVAGLDSEDEGIRQKSATEIIEGELGKATQNAELGGMFEVLVKYANGDRNDTEAAS